MTADDLGAQGPVRLPYMPRKLTARDVRERREDGLRVMEREVQRRIDAAWIDYEWSPALNTPAPRARKAGAK